MEYLINETGCRQLSLDILGDMRQIAGILSDFSSNDSILRRALGEDYDAFNRSVRVIASQLNSASGELSIINSNMQEYMQRVHQTRVVIEG